MIILFVLTMYLASIVDAQVRMSRRIDNKIKRKKNTFVYHYTRVK